MNSRQLALEWWSILNNSTKTLYCSEFYFLREPLSLTGREIEKIYNHKFHLPKSLHPPTNVKIFENQFKVDTYPFLVEIVEGALREGMGVLKVPINVFRIYLINLVERSLELNDPVLNMIMCNMGLYEQASPSSKEYNQEMINKVREEYFKFVKEKE